MTGRRWDVPASRARIDRVVIAGPWRKPRRWWHVLGEWSAAIVVLLVAAAAFVAVLGALSR